MFKAIDLHRASIRVSTIIFLAAMNSTAAADGAFITEPRNAAAGFAIVLWMTNADALGKHCSMVKGEAGEQSRRAFDGWQRRNGAYVRAAFGYMVKVEDSIAEKYGEKARQDFRSDRIKEADHAARESEAAWFPTAEAGSEPCLHMAKIVASGATDLDQSQEFFPALREIKAELDKFEQEDSANPSTSPSTHGPAPLSQQHR